MNETKLQREKINSVIADAAMKAGITKTDYLTDEDEAEAIITVDTEDIQAIYEKYKETPDIFESSELEAFATSIGQTKDEVLAMKEAILQYDTALAENETILQAQSEALLSSQISEKTADYKYSKELIAGMAVGFAKNQDDREEEIAKNFEYGKYEVAKDSEYFQTLAKEAGVDSTKLTGDNTNDLEVLYAKMAGISTEEIADDLKGNIDKLTAEIAKIQVAKEAGDQADQVHQAMSKLNEDAQKNYAILMSKDTTDANQSFINKFSFTSIGELRTMAAKMGFQADVENGKVVKTAEQKLAESLGYDTVSDMQAGFEEIAQNAEEEFAKIRIKAAEYQINTDKNYLNKMTTEQLQNYVNLLAQADLTDTKESLEKGFGEIFTAATDEQRQKISTLMSTFDWTKQGAGEEFLEDLEEMGIFIDKTNPDMKTFIDNLKGVDAVFRDFELSSIVDSTKASIEEAEEIADQSELTTEQYEKFLRKGLIDVNEWTFNGKGWVNVENGMSDLVTALMENTKATFMQAQQEAKTQVEFYESINSKIEAYGERNQYNSILIQNGTAGGRILEDVGITQDEYNRWKDLSANNAVKYNAARALANMDYNFNATSPGKTKYENSHDKQYNTYEKVNALLREREKLERQYDKILKNRSKSAAELIENSREQLANLAEQKKYQEYLQDAKLQEIKDLMSENSKYSSYVTGFNEITGTISIDWDAFERLKDSDKGSKIDDYLSELEELRDQWQEAQDTLEEIEDNTEELKTQGRDEYLDLENRLKDALVANRQKEIDKLSEINDSINDTNSKLLDSMQQQIDEYRQNRDNEKTEKELEDKQRRLAYLQQDTSGANAMEILNLQKEIEEGQESYTDQLIDQKISELQKQNDQAAEQRQQQIDLLQAQLDYDEENGRFWPEVSKIMNDVVNGNTAVAVRLLRDAEGYKGMSEEQKKDFDDEFAASQKGSAVYSANKNLPEEEEKSKEEKTPGSRKIASLPNSTNLSKEDIKNLQAGLNELDKDGHLKLSKKLDEDGIYGPKTKAAVKLLQQKVGSSADGIWGPDTRAKFLGSNLSSYKTGGLADFTGPAWLDGTKSKPEYILNADQTKAFFTLVDVLSGITSKGAQSTQNNGDSNYDIDINVESIGSDYDVEQLVSKIKSLINEDARYRNNNAISLMR